MTALTTRGGLPPQTAIDEHDRPLAVVIDDDTDVRTRISRTLRQAGWRAVEARNGEHGLLMVREHVPDVVLVDLALPTMSGLDVLRELKSACWADQPTPVVVVSWYASLVRLPYLRLADGLVAKPFEAGELIEQVWLARARRRAPRLV
ncbi:MAG: response regulator [Chloroflexota bacterium]|nr:response regulator [Chloroflexota bacterium]